MKTLPRCREASASPPPVSGDMENLDKGTTTGTNPELPDFQKVLKRGDKLACCLGNSNGDSCPTGSARAMSHRHNCHVPYYSRDNRKRAAYPLRGRQTDASARRGKRLQQKKFAACGCPVDIDVLGDSPPPSTPVEAADRRDRPAPYLLKIKLHRNYHRPSINSRFTRILHYERWRSARLLSIRKLPPSSCIKLFDKMDKEKRSARTALKTSFDRPKRACRRGPSLRRHDGDFYPYARAIQPAPADTVAA